MKKRLGILCTIAVLAAVLMSYTYIQKQHTVTLSNEDGIIKAEQIQPLFKTVEVSVSCDTDVVFTDVRSGEKYVIEYITSGVSEKISLESGRWYSVAGGGELVIGPVNVRIE